MDETTLTEDSGLIPLNDGTGRVEITTPGVGVIGYFTEDTGPGIEANVRPANGTSVQASRTARAHLPGLGLTVPTATKPGIAGR